MTFGELKIGDRFTYRDGRPGSAADVHVKLSATEHGIIAPVPEVGDDHKPTGRTVRAVVPAGTARAKVPVEPWPPPEPVATQRRIR